MIDTWISVIFPSEKKLPSGLRATDPDPGMSNSTRYFYEGNVLRSHALAAQAAFDQALALAMSGEAPKVVSESEWKRVAAQAVEPMRREKSRLYSEKRRAAGEEQKRRRAEAKATAQAERNGHAPEVTDEDLRDAAVEDSLTLALADGDPDMHDEPAGEDGEQP